MKANNSTTICSTDSRPIPPNLPEANHALLSSTTISSGAYREAGGSSPPPQLPFSQSGKAAMTREQLLATLKEASAIIADSESLDFVSDANSLSLSREEYGSRRVQ
jgi:hypothetical protein